MYLAVMHHLRNHDDFAEELPRLHHFLSLPQFRERQGLASRNRQLAFGHAHHAESHILLGVAIRSYYAQLTYPDVSNIGLWIEAGRRAAGEQLAVTLQGLERRDPRLATREIHADIDAFLSTELPGLGREVLRALIDDVVGAELLQLLTLVVASRAGNDPGSKGFRKLN